MIEIRVHGRGGQGGVTLAKLIATTRFLQGDSVQAFGLYAAERSGAPVQAFCRYDAEPIENRNLIYEPDHVVVLDSTLIGPAVAGGLKPGGWIVLNTPQPPDSLRESFPAHRLATVDATAIALANGLGTRAVPIVNTALAGAVGRVLGFELGHVRAAVEHLGFAGGNLAAADQAYEATRLLDSVAAEGAAGPAAAAAPPARSPSFITGAGGGWPTIRTGQWASQQPARQQMVPPCNHVCPAGNDVQGFLQALARDQTDEALAILLRVSPFPGVCGRVCPAPCMDSCNRIDLDGAVNVRELERFAADHGTVALVPGAERGERVAIVGSGPAGLTAAYHLALFGYRVTVLEGGLETGGLLRTGIPGYRLPDAVVDREIGRITDLGVELVTGAPVDRARLLDLARAHDAVLVATGLQELRGLEMVTAGSETVLQGIDFLERVHRGAAGLENETVVVVGGGNTAVDAARSALRVGAERAIIVYRRSPAEMPAIREEIEQALEEGVELETLTLPVAIRESAGTGARCVLTCRWMELGEPDASGRRRPLEIAGSDFELPCDRVILALGQSPDLSVFPEGTEIREGERLLGMIETPVFAVGDLATHDGTVASAIGSGRRSALHIHETLSGELLGGGEHAAARRHVDVWRDEVVRPEAMKLHLFERARRSEGGVLDPWERTWNFAEVHRGLDDASEARRCLSCGVCNECDACVTFCPEGVLKRVGEEFVFDYSFCKGCAVCASECPRNVIFMSHM
ncbi:MAG: 2-oxoacid:acceptor oxidoreductase family protein [Acidobacteriota bacterium]|nr:2-oxoacid:acceptor oxidoreductase family protein [Acidobacteriota bacterium]MDH3523302.1 2-oxoacid:acceptor oxidoreductase family protein [Acidobacteriota bacterium]